MATFSVIGTSSTLHVPIGNSSGIGDRDLDIALPSGAMVGDLIVIGMIQLGGANHRGVKAVLTPGYTSILAAFDNPNWKYTGAYGVTPDLGDVTVTLAWGHGVLAVVLALRDVTPSTIFSQSTEPDPTDDPAIPETPEFATSIAFIADSTDNFPSTPDTSIGDAADWTTEAFADYIDVYLGDAMKAYTYVGPSPMPALSAAASADVAGDRLAVLLTFTDIVPVATRPVLRQRQSPLWAPSRNSDSYHLRNNQTPYL